MTFSFALCKPQGMFSAASMFLAQGFLPSQVTDPVSGQSNDPSLALALDPVM